MHLDINDFLFSRSYWSWSNSYLATQLQLFSVSLNFLFSLTPLAQLNPFTSKHLLLRHVPLVLVISYTVNISQSHVHEMHGNVKLSGRWFVMPNYIAIILLNVWHNYWDSMFSSYICSRWQKECISTVLPQIMARVFISFQQFLTRPLNETGVYYRKKHMLFIICDASDEF